MKLFLDDERLPPGDGDGWVIVRNISDAIEWVKANGFPLYVSFDNDLGELQPEGRCFAAWLLELDMDMGSMPNTFDYYVHSQNVDAADRIRSRIDGHLVGRAREKAAEHPWPPNRSKEPWGQLNLRSNKPRAE